MYASFQQELKKVKTWSWRESVKDVAWNLNSLWSLLICLTLHWVINLGTISSMLNYDDDPRERKR